MSEQNKQLVREFIEAFSRGDAAAAEACLAPDAVITARGFGKLSGPRSHDVIVATTGAFKTLIPEGLRPQFQSIIAEGDRVAVEFTGDATLVNGARYCNEYCITYVIRDGKIATSNEYYCTILADDRIGPLLAEIEGDRQQAKG